MKKIKMLACVLLAVISAGCANTKSLGTIGTTRFFAVNARSFSGPNITALVTQDVAHPANVTIQAATGGPGIGHTVIGAAGNVGASAAFGLSLRPSNTSVRSGSTSASNSDSDSSSVAQSHSDADAENNTSIHRAPEPPIHCPVYHR